MRTALALAVLVLGANGATAQTAGGGGESVQPQLSIRGVVRDEGGKGLENVKVQVCGLNTYANGAWHKIFRSGIMPSYSTDTNGMFSVSRGDTNLAYDMYFDKPGYAPVFVNTVTNKSDLSVVLKRGETMIGRVVRNSGGTLEPVSGTQVELRLPTSDLFYQQRTMTDHTGKYVFRVLPPPGGKKWQVVFAGEVVQVDVEEGKPVVGPDFEVTVKVQSLRNGAPGQTDKTTGGPGGNSVMDNAQMITLAQANAKKAGYSLNDYESPSVLPQVNESGHGWTIRFQSKLPAKPDHFDVHVNDETGEAVLLPGK